MQATLAQVILALELALAQATREPQPEGVEAWPVVLAWGPASAQAARANLELESRQVEEWPAWSSVVARLPRVSGRRGQTLVRRPVELPRHATSQALPL